MSITYNRKDKLPSETINFIKNILKNNKIKVKKSKILSINNSLFSVRIELKNICGVGANGKGITDEYALASAYAEFMERLQSGFLIKSEYLGKENLKKNFKDGYMASFNKIEKYFFKDEYKELVLSNERYCWVTSFYNPLKNNYEYLPIKLINLLTHSNGLCAGNSKEEALVQGICEIFERYCYKKILINEIEIPTIEIENKEKYTVYKQLEELKKLNLSYTIKDCSLGGKFPVVGIIIYNSSYDKYLFSVGADVDFNIALQRCITEIFQGISKFEIESKMKNLNNEYEKNKEKYGKEFVLTNWLKCYSSNNGIHPKSLFNNAKKVNIERLPFSKINNNKKALEILYKILKKEKLDIYIKDYSQLGFNTYKIYIPNISEIDELDKLKLETMKHFPILKNIYFNMYDAIDKLSDKEVLLLFKISMNEKYQTFMLPSNVFETINFIESDYTKLNFFYILIVYLSINKKYSQILNFVELKLKSGKVSKFESSYLFCIKDIINKNDCQRKYSLNIINDVNALLFDTKKYLKKLKAPTCPNCKKCPIRKKCKYKFWKKINNILVQKYNEYIKKEF